LTALEQKLSALDDQLSLFKQTIDATTEREQGINSSIQDINSRIADDKTRVDELLPRLALGEKTYKDLGILISLCVNRIKTVNVNATDLARRLSDLETHVRSKAEQLGENIAGEAGQSADEIEKSIAGITAKPVEEAVPIAANGKDVAILEEPATLAQASSSGANADREDRPVGSHAEQHAT
jgi:predicted  nucleic acid-binding Zn-ribbon protein